MNAPSLLSIFGGRSTERKHILGRYAKTDEGFLIIDITTDRIEDLYDNFDKHAPYMKKDLETEFVDYLIDAVGEIGDERFIIRIRVGDHRGVSHESRVKTSIRNYFMYLREIDRRDLKRMVRTSLALFAAGFSFLVFSVVTNERIVTADTLVTRIFAEGLTVLAWVSLWESLAMLFINLKPRRRQMRIYERLASAHVEVREGRSGYAAE